MDWVMTLLGATRARILKTLRRSAAPISDLARGLGITGNAVRGHVSALQRDGLVRDVGSGPSTGGKPAQIYDLTAEGEELFPKGYAIVLRELIQSLELRDGPDVTADLLQEVGRRAAGDREGVGEGEDVLIGRAVAALRSIGGEVTASKAGDGWDIRGIGCPLNSVVKEAPATCTVAQAVVAHVTGASVEECCDRSGERARCAFRVTRIRMLRDV